MELGKHAELSIVGDKQNNTLYVNELIETQIKIILWFHINQKIWNLKCLPIPQGVGLLRQHSTTPLLADVCAARSPHMAPKQTSLQKCLPLCRHPPIRCKIHEGHAMVFGCKSFLN